MLTNHRLICIWVAVMMSSAAFAQNIFVSGNVTDSEGQNRNYRREAGPCEGSDLSNFIPARLFSASQPSAVSRTIYMDFAPPGSIPNLR